MTQLTTTQSRTSQALTIRPEVEQALSVLSDTHRQIISASLQPRLKNIPAEQSEDSLVEIIASTYLRAGQSADPMQLPVYAAEFYRRLMQEFPVATLEEIKAAMEEGIYGRYGDFFGLNTRTFILWVREYITSQERKAAQEEFYKAKRLRQAEIERPQYWRPDYWTEEHIATWKTNTNTFYHYFCNNDPMYKAVPTQVYWLLRHQSLISITDERKEQLLQLAKENLRRGLLENRQRRSPIEIENMLKAIVANSDKLTRLELQLEAKRIAVRQFFYECLKQDKTSIF